MIFLSNRRGFYLVNIRIAHPRNAHWRAILRWAILSMSFIRISHPNYFDSLLGFGLQLVPNVVFTQIWNGELSTLIKQQFGRYWKMVNLPLKSREKLITIFNWDTQGQLTRYPRGFKGHSRENPMIHPLHCISKSRRIHTHHILNNISEKDLENLRPDL